jgi:hypothetical protein
MTHDHDLRRAAERPRSEPEIIPPGEEASVRRTERIWVSFDDRGGHRIYVTRLGWPSIILGLLILGAVTAALFLLVAGVLLIWLPVLIGGIVLALLAGALRHRLRRLRDWFSSSR